MSNEKKDTESKTAIIKAEINKQLGDADTFKSLLNTVFKTKNGPMDPGVVKSGVLEWVLRGGEFTDFLSKDVYIIPYGDSYSLVTSIDYSRKIGAKSGIVGVDAPVYAMNQGKIDTCSVTVKKKIGDYVGEFTALVFFNEYTTGKNLWTSKPRTMIAKVAEMSALRKACPEELAKAYGEEELEKEKQEPVKAVALDVEALKAHEQALLEEKDLESLDRYWADLPGEFRPKLKNIYEGQRAILVQECKDIV
jgi:hypothetical protein